MKHHGSSLWLAVRLPYLSLEAIGYNQQSPMPVVISHKRRVYRCNALALAAGITQDISLATAQALLNCVVLERDPDQEQQALQHIAETCYQFTPYIEFHGDQGLLLEVSRSLNLFQGIESLKQQLSKKLLKFPHHYCHGLAHTGKAAWLLSWQNYPVSEQDNRETFRQRLQQVPVDHLTEFPDAVIALQQSGFRTLGDLVTQMQANEKAGSSAAIRKRFGTAFTDYLEDIFGSPDHAQGQLFSRPPEIFKPDEIFQEQIQFDYPIVNSEQLRDPMRQLLENLVDELMATQRQCHGIQWRLYDIHQNRQELNINSERIHSQWQLPLDLTMIQLEHTALSFEVDSLELVCNSTTPVEIGNRHLLNQHPSSQNAGDNERLFARLAARLGESSLSKLSYHDNLLPENCQQTIAVTEISQMQLPAQQLNTPRPSWLFNSPKSIQKKHQQLFWHGQLKLLQGPERLQGHWWNTPSARDYFMAQRSDYLRCWIYQDLKSQEWYVHGIFS